MDMKRTALKLLRHAVLGLATCILVSSPARADKAITLFQSYTGNINFVGTQTTLRTKSDTANGNNKSCSVANPNKKLRTSLSGIPADATILSAHLYWAGSGATADYEVKVNGADVTAPGTRRYTSATIGSGFNYFAGAIDVTPQVTAQRNGEYEFSDLTVDNGEPFCAVDGVVGGFSLVAIYSSPSEQYRMLNLYEGFQHIRNSSVTLNLSNFKIPALAAGSKGRVAHITWEGDATLDGNGENLRVNKISMTDSMNLEGKQFNSKSNINGDTESYGVDFDAYDVVSPVINEGDTTASTTYTSGQDLVLLNAEIIAIPYLPAADLSISMARNSPLVRNANASYTLTITNSGPSNETGPVTIVDVLPASLSYVGAGGAGWTCVAAGQRITCTFNGPLTVGASLPALVVTARVIGTGTITHTASVSGQMFDNISSNNTASNTGTVVEASERSYELTDLACIPGIAIGAPGQPCARAKPHSKAGAQVTNLFVTAINTVEGAVIPTPPSDTKATTVAMQFLLGCQNPKTANAVQATVGNIGLGLCYSAGVAPTASFVKTADLGFVAGKASAVLPAFQYNDVGEVFLAMRDANGIKGESLPFAVRPAYYALSQIKGLRTIDGPVEPASKPFAKAGEAFSMRVAAYTVGGVVTPNFGNEDTRQTIKLDQSAYTGMSANPLVLGSFGEFVDGVASGDQFVFNDAGIIQLSPSLEAENYLSTPPPPDDDKEAAKKAESVPVNIGPFIPHHFDTIIKNAEMTCEDVKLGCGGSVDKMVYARQPFDVEVLARTANDTTTKNFAGVFARLVRLEAWDGHGAAPRKDPRDGALAKTDVNVADFLAGTATVAQAYTLPGRYDDADPRGRDSATMWTEPTRIHIRAIADAADAYNITSLRGEDTVEGGIGVALGRLKIADRLGSEVLGVPVALSAQYWNGSQWVENRGDNFSIVKPDDNLVYTRCLGKLKDTGKALPENCTNTPSAKVPNSVIEIRAGKGQFVLNPSGAGNTGSARLRVNSHPWLPAASGNLVFGIQRSPLIYVRELY